MTVDKGGFDGGSRDRDFGLGGDVVVRRALAPVAQEVAKVPEMQAADPEVQAAKPVVPTLVHFVRTVVDQATAIIGEMEAEDDLDTPEDGRERGPRVVVSPFRSSQMAEMLVTAMNQAIAAGNIPRVRNLIAQLSGFIANISDDE